MNRYIIDRISENVVFLETENGDIINVDLEKFAYIPAEGDAVIFEDDKFYFNKERTDELKTIIEKEFKELLKH